MAFMVEQYPCDHFDADYKEIISVSWYFHLIRLWYMLVIETMTVIE